MPGTYYNEIDPFCADWLRNLIFHGLIADGDVDTRSVEDVLPSDLKGYTQCHFFAGIGVWSLALRNAGWRDDEPVWTGSCPCQPFSAAGKRGGVADERHLWPAWFHLIEECRPRVVFGEQVASKAGLGWLDLVQADLEGAGYASAAVDLCAAGVGAPHIRQRLYFVADSDERKRGRLSDGEGCERNRAAAGWQQSYGVVKSGGEPSVLGDAERKGLAQQRSKRGAPCGSAGANSRQTVKRAGAPVSFWSDCDWLPCIDGKARPVEPGTQPLAYGIAGRVGRLRAYGNALVAPCATAFIRAYREIAP